jgi:hypothetical protein
LWPRILVSKIVDVIILIFVFKNFSFTSTFFNTHITYYGMCIPVVMLVPNKYSSKMLKLTKIEENISILTLEGSTTTEIEYESSAPSTISHFL